MPPPGGRRASINVSYQYGSASGTTGTGTPAEQQRYGWGQTPALFGAQDLGQRFAQQFQPGAGLFSPNYPLVPVEPELARLWDYPVGYNYIYTPRSYEPVSFEELRALARNESLTRLAIETRKDQMEKLDWQIKLRDEKNAAKDADKRISKLTDFWHHPDGERPFASWLREALEDLLVIDAPTFEVLKNRDGTVRGYDVVDGSTIHVLIDQTGRRPTAPAPAYQQVIHGRPWRLFAEDELIYIPRNKRPGHVYGYGPVEQILTYINICLRRQLQQLYWFTEGNLPAGFLGIPDLNPNQIQQLQEWIDSKFSGNLAERSKFQPFPYGAKFTPIKGAPLKDEFDEWLARIVMFCFSLPPDAFVRQRNRSTSETARETALEEGLAPMMGWVKRLVDAEIQGRMGHPDLEFSWQEIKQIDAESQSKVEALYAKMGLKSPDEVRDVLGLDPLPDGAGASPYVIAGNQVLLVKDIEAASAQAVAPKPPPPTIFPPGTGAHPPTGAAGPQAPGGAGPSSGRAPGGGGGQPNGRGGAEPPGALPHGARSQEPAAGKASARSLYVRRPLINRSELRDWAKAQGFTSTLKPEDMHVTIAYSRRPVDWSAVGDPSGATVWSSDPVGRTVELLGDEGAVVLKFTHYGLATRHQQFLDAGASWDYDSYRPHVTITYDGAPPDLSKVEPFGGELAFGPEIFEQINDDDSRSDARALKYGRRFHGATAPAPRPGPRPGADGGRREALDREARHLLRRHRASRVEADLRAVGA